MGIQVSIVPSPRRQAASGFGPGLSDRAANGDGNRDGNLSGNPKGSRRMALGRDHRARSRGLRLWRIAASITSCASGGQTALPICMKRRLRDPCQG